MLCWNASPLERQHQYVTCEERYSECDTMIHSADVSCHPRSVNVCNCVSDCQMCGWMRATDCSRRPRWFICPSYPQTQLYSWTPTSTGRCACACACVWRYFWTLIMNKYLKPFSPTGCSSNHLQRNSTYFLLIQPRGEGGMSPFPFTSLFTPLCSLSQRMLGV